MICDHCGCVADKPKSTKMRSVPQHRRYFAMIRAAHSHWPESHRFTPVTEDRLRKWLQAKAGHHTIRTVDTAGMSKTQAVIAIAAEISAADPVHFVSAAGDKFFIIESQSIDFDTLPHLSACALYDAVADVIEMETGLKVAQIMPPISEKRAVKPDQFAQVPL